MSKQRVLLLAGILAVAAILAPHAHAQTAWGYSNVSISLDGSTYQAAAATELDYSAAAYYDASVSVTLTGDAYWSQSAQGATSATVSTWGSTGTGSHYHLEGQHSLTLTTPYDYEHYGYWDPYNLGSCYGGSGSSTVACWGYYSETHFIGWTNISLGSTAMNADMLPPVINPNGIVPWSGSVRRDTPSYLEIYGQYLGSVTYVEDLQGYDISFSVSYASNYQVNVYYTISGTAALGTHWLRLHTPAGYSDGSFVVSARPPNITGIQPAFGYRGDAGTMQIYGQDLDATQSITTNGGLTVNSGYASSPYTTMNASYYVATNAYSGGYTVTVTTSGGQSSATFTVGDSTPSISSISPPSLQAGSSYVPVTIYGSGFGWNPSIAVSGTGVTATVDNPNNIANDTQIAAHFTVSENAEATQRTVTITSHSFGGNNFISTGGSQPSSNSGEFTVQSPPAPTLEVMAGGQAVGQSSTVWINADPALPTLTARLVGSNLTYNATWSITFQWQDPYGGGNRSATYPPIPSGPRSLPASQTWSISGEMNGEIVGGTATIYWTYPPLPTQVLSFYVRGYNPTSQTVKGYASQQSSFWALPKQIRQESDYLHFVSDQPRTSSDHGYGLMQLTSGDPTFVQIWDWHANVTEGVSRLNGFQSGANSAWQTHVANYTTWLQQHPDAPPPDPETFSYCTFTYPQAGNRSFADAIALKKYNSGPATPDYLEWDNLNHQWVPHPTVGNYPNYVAAVCSHSDTF